MKTVNLLLHRSVMPAIKSMMMMRSRPSRRVAVQCGGAAEMAAGMDGESCWSKLPQELLREVLAGIEASESSWPARKSVVACGGVCRSWRLVVQELVRVPELAGILTFPISVKQPGPRDFLLQCFIRRCLSTQTYYVYLSLDSALAEDGKFLLAAHRCRRATCTDYIISLAVDDMSKGSGTYVGKVRSNFIGTKFTVFDGQPSHAGAKMMKSRSSRLLNLKQVSQKVPTGNYPVANISYELNVLGSRGPRKMQCIMDGIPAAAIKPGGVAPTQTEFLPPTVDFFPHIPFLRSRSTHSEKLLSGPLSVRKDEALVLQNKALRWHEQLQCWCLNFHGRVTVASVKKFQLVACPENEPAGPEHEKIILQFGKVGKDLFTMDYRSR